MYIALPLYNEVSCDDSFPEAPLSGEHFVRSPNFGEVRVGGGENTRGK